MVATHAEDERDSRAVRCSFRVIDGRWLCAGVLIILPLSSRLRIILTPAQSEMKIDFLLDGLPSFIPHPPDGWRD